jgi:hypothetical protein
LALWFAAVLLLLSLPSFAQSAIPNQWFDFPPGFDAGAEFAPRAYTTNLISTPMVVEPGSDYPWSALILDTTNLTPAFLNYNVLDTSPRTNRNLGYSQGTVLFWYAPNWASVSQGGAGPGQTAYLVAGGDWRTNSPNGLFAIYIDSGGSNLCFGGVGAGDFETYVSVPISWSSNVFHQIGVEWITGDCEIYLDGSLAATGNGIIYVPKRSTWASGFFVGSDNNGYQQMRGSLWEMYTWGKSTGDGILMAFPRFPMTSPSGRALRPGATLAQ